MVEDEALLRDALALWLTQRGFRIIVAADCASGIRQAVSQRPHAILLDLNLPDAPGFELLRELRAADLSIPFVVLTGSGSPIDGFHAHKFGAGHFLEKPAMPDQIAFALRQAAGAQDLWDVGSQLSELTRLADLANPDAQRTLRKRLVEVVADRRVDLVDFAFLSPLLAQAMCDTAVSKAGLFETADRLRRHREQMDPSVLALIRAVGESHPSTHDGVQRLPRSARHRVFASTGKRYSSWVRLARLRLALQELVRDDEHVSQIAHRLGYPHVGQLTRDIRSLLESSPRDLRRRLRTQIAN